MPRPVALVLSLLVLAFAIGVFVFLSFSGSSDRALTSPISNSLPPPTPPTPPAVTMVLTTIKEADRGALAVSEEDGRLLRILVSAGRTNRALEIGAASGYSAIWIGLGLRDSGGKLTTIEYDPVRAREAAANIAKAGLSEVVTVIAGDAFAEIPRLSGTFDFVFLDAWKKDYLRFSDLVLPRLDRGGLFVAHNVVNKRNEMSDFLAAIQDNPDLETVIVAPSGEGLSISVKLR